ncbi:MAG: PDZ domain-containing protein [Candidatus Brocadiales bacterium]
MKKAIWFLFAATMYAGCAYMPIGMHGFGIDKTRKGEGIVVHAVKEGSPAEKAGIQKGDIIVSVGGKKAEDPYVVAKEIAEELPGKKVLMKIVRKGKSLDIELLIERKVLQILNADMTGVSPDYSLVMVEGYFWLGSYPYPMTPGELENLRTYLRVYDLDHIPPVPFTIFTLKVR